MGTPRRVRPRRLLRFGFPCLLLVAAVAVAPSTALAASPLKIREVYPGSAADPAAEFVELQMTANDQGSVAGQELVFYDSTATPTSTFAIPSNVVNGGSQRAVLLATEAAREGLAIPAPDFDLGSDNALDAAGGAVCLTGASPADCATWGSFPLFGPLDPFPNAQAANAAAIADGMALQRTISRGCATLLDEADDSNNSAVDFAQVAVAAVNNDATPSESPCPPNTAIDAFPANPTNSTSAAFTYAALPAEQGASFRCSLDDATIAHFGDCTPGTSKSYSSLTEGTHTFRVFATGAGGPDPTPASYTWTIDTTAPETIIDSGPPDPSSGFSATFAFHSSEASSSFRCQLDSDPVQLCSSTKTYINLLTGAHVFRVYAIDNAGNEDAIPATFAFSVDNSIEDLTSPDTTIVSAPSSPSVSEDAAFAYASSEQGSTFECSLDDGGFSPCAGSGASYSRLKNGPHVFRVKSTDKAGNPDRVPASYSWSVAAPLPIVKIVKAPPGHATIRKPRARKLVATFRFSASKPGSSFRCRLDKQPFRLCSPTMKVKVGLGRHRFEVYAVDSLGNVGTVTARRIFRVQLPQGGGVF